MINKALYTRLINTMCGSESIVKEFSEYKAYMDSFVRYGDTRYNSICSDKILNSFYDSKTIDKRLCIQSASHIADIYYKAAFNNPTDGKCSFLYYWIYHYLIKNKKSNETKNLFNVLLKAYENFIGNYQLCSKYKPTSAEHILSKHTYIYDMHMCINKEYEKGNTNKMPFCEALNNIIDEKNKQTQELIQALTEPQPQAIEISEASASSKCRSNTAVPILGTIILIISIYYLFLFVDKFTPYGKLLRRAKKKLKYKWDKSWKSNVLENYDIRSSIPEAWDYNLLYN
ncbi:variable surface protein [Plasmodium gonderi]|uniref:Variable surface protein n=1 Tax=Plasmodium gonderi TaxID=77519 RepID=A0A1Y1JSB8_PLAGO|nr:variable surface protein [Plasmodium gonderi]GAW84077.1 variable surface protein [Plasmodium gonderi]